MTNKYSFRLRFNRKAIKEWAECFLVEEGAEPITDLVPKVRAQGFYAQEDLEAFCYWKSPRTRRRVAQNSGDYTEAVTRTALTTPNERLRIEILLLLNGVSWPTASVLLHFAHEEQYPILDFRALWSVGLENYGKYDFDLWWQYTQYCRNLANETKRSMREVDRALWMYSKVNQRQATKAK